jgi:copper ion binding protein
MKTTLSIKGMSCKNCVKHVTSALKEIAGVSEATVSLENNSAEVVHADSVTMTALRAAVEEAGYEVA